MRISDWSSDVCSSDLVECALQQGAEDGRLDVLPLVLGGDDQKLQVVFGDLDGAGVFEEAAVELRDLHFQAGRELTHVHLLPKVAQGEMKIARVAAKPLEEVRDRKSVGEGKSV